MAKRSAFAKPLVHAPPGKYQPWRLVAVRTLRWFVDRAPASMRSGAGKLARLAERLRMSELWLTDVMAYRVEKARKMGMTVGERCRFYSLHVASEAELIEIGNDVIVSGEVMFITHDGAIFTALDQFPDVNGHYGRIRIGDGCFLGMRAVIMPGVELGEHCIVAAGAVVMDSFPPRSVIAGNPATFVVSQPLYLDTKRHHPATMYDRRYAFPLKYPADALRERLANVPFKAPRRRDRNAAIAKPLGDS
jgi:acetyltransferase-like isoleucine patch superfamily enzyme